MYEQIFICILKILNFVFVCFLLFSPKKCANIERCSFTDKPKRKKRKFYPSSAGDIWVSGYVHRRLKRGHPGHKKLNPLLFLFKRRNTK